MGSCGGFTEVPCASYHDVAHTARLGRLLVCEKGETTQLLREVDGRWQEVALAPAHVASRSLGVLKLPRTGGRVIQHLFAPGGR